MKYCPNCGKQIPDGVKFCPYCGYKILKDSIEGDSEINDGAENTIQVETLAQENTSNTSVAPNNNKSIFLKLLFSLIVIAGIVFFFFKYNTPETSYSKSHEIEKLVGTWYDPFGIVLKKDNTIRISHEGDNAVGEDTKGEITISITPVGVNHYRGHFIFQGIDSDNDVRYDEESGKLIFTNRLLGTELYIIKKGY